MKGIIKLKYSQSSIGENEVVESYSKAEVQLPCFISKDIDNKEFIEFDFKFPDYNITSKIKYYFKQSDFGERTFSSIDVFNIFITSIIKNNSEELIICGNLSVIDLNIERVDNFLFIIKVINTEINNYFNDNDCFTI